MSTVESRRTGAFALCVALRIWNSHGLRKAASPFSLLHLSCLRVLAEKGQGEGVTFGLQSVLFWWRPSALGCSRLPDMVASCNPACRMRELGSCHEIFTRGSTKKLREGGHVGSHEVATAVLRDVGRVSSGCLVSQAYHS